MRTTLPFLTAASLFLAIGCGQSREHGPGTSIADIRYEEDATEGASVAQPEAPEPRTALSSSAASYRDSSRRFVRTGDLRFRTDDVVKSSFAIEALVARHGGHVASTHLATEVLGRYNTAISADSLLETTRYTVVNRLTVRVPSIELDTTLKSLIALVDFLDHRTLTATDVRIALLRDRLTRDRLARHDKRLTNAIDDKDAKLKETVTAEDRLIDRQQQADEVALSTLEMEDRIAFSTLTLDIYQREGIRRELLPNEQNIEAYEPGFFSKASEALRTGWELLKDVTLALLRSWSVLLLLAIAFVAYRRIVRRAK
ncbi:MAG: DUF4349 domain-containing protein [Flavobacteriales bacterium]|nr:DUF4349 domain-containing protein [Flavobacteriales bacterium]